MNYTYVYTYFLPVPCSYKLIQGSTFLLICMNNFVVIDTEKSKISQVFLEQEHIRLPSTYFSHSTIINR